jgi:hypothetical protein
MLAEAENTGIVQFHGSAIEFTHPLFASTVYEMVTARERRRAHAALARVVKDLEERARHLALSVTDENEEVAVALEQAAAHAGARGAPFAAAELYQLAAAITPVDQAERKSRRRVSSAGSPWGSETRLPLRAATSVRSATMPRRASVGPLPVLAASPRLVPVRGAGNG